MSKYIDAEGIMRACFSSYVTTNNKAYMEIANLANGVPAADVQEVRHGRWINDGHTLACSNCHTINIRGVEYAYCPNCGASMDGDTE